MRLGEAEPSERLSASQSARPSGTQGGVADPCDGGGNRVVHRHRERERGVAPTEFLEDARGLQVRQAEASIVWPNEQSSQPRIADGPPGVARGRFPGAEGGHHALSDDRPGAPLGLVHPGQGSR